MLVFLLFACSPEKLNHIEEPELQVWSYNGYEEETILFRWQDGSDVSPDYFGEPLQTTAYIDGLGIQAVEVPMNMTALTLIDHLRSHPRVDFVEPNLYRNVRPSFVEAPEEEGSRSVNDPLAGRQWHMDQIQVPDISSDYWGSGIVVAVLDSGVSSDGNDSFDSLSAGYDYFSNDSDPADENGHGTHVAGTIAQATNNGVGVRGVAPDATIMPVRILGPSGSGNTLMEAQGIAYAVNNGADILNLSLTSENSNSTEQSAIQYALDNDVVVIAAAGNDGNTNNGVGYPAAYTGVIGVSSVGYNQSLAPYSNAGPEIDFAAPGGNTGVDQSGDGQADGVYQETIINGNWNYYYYQGTSMAAPHVAGAYAVLMAAGATGSEATAALQATAIDLGTTGNDDLYGDGLIQLSDALDQIVSGQNASVDSLSVGDIVISEVMHNPSVVADYRGEWFEIYNASSGSINLNGLVVVGSGSETFSISTDVVVASGAYAVFAARDNANENGGVSSVSYRYSRGDMKLDLGDSISLQKTDGSVLDAITYAPSLSFPTGTGASLSLGSLSTTHNDTGTYWCESSSTFGDGDLGTPGSANDSCDNPILTAAAVDSLSAGDLLVTEIMHDPTLVADYRGEWFEIHNTTSGYINLKGLVVAGLSSSGFVVDQNILLEAGGYTVFGARDNSLQNGGVENISYDYARSVFKLNLGGLISLRTSNLTVIDEVTYAPSLSFPTGAGASLSLGSLSATHNDTGTYWCESTSSYGDGDLGTPGSANDSCNNPLIGAIAVDDLVTGDIVISEIMHDPIQVADYRGEWFEIYNATASDINLNGLVVGGSGSESFTLSSDVLLQAGSYVVFGARDNSLQNGGIANVDYRYLRNAFKLDQGDTISLQQSDGTELDSVTYAPVFSFPNGNGSSMSLSSLSATANDTGTNWCESTSSYGDGDFGTPGSANDSCD